MLSGRPADARASAFFSGLPGSAAGAHCGRAALAPAPESCRGDPQAGSERRHVRRAGSSWWDHAVVQVALLPTTSSTVLPTLGTGCSSVGIDGCAVGMQESRLGTGHGQLFWVTPCLLWPLLVFQA